MTTIKTLEQQQIAALNRVLAEATTERRDHGPTCSCCEPTDVVGTRLVARFPGFRRECIGQPPCMYPGCDSGHQHKRKVGDNHSSCCYGTGWQVRAGGLEDVLAGLNSGDYSKTLDRLQGLRFNEPGIPMLSADEILAKGLELVCEIAGLEVPE